MIEHDQAVVKTDVAIGRFEIVDSATREFWLGEVFQIVTPVAKAATKRKRQINFLKQLETRHEAVEQMPRIAELNVAADGRRRRGWLGRRNVPPPHVGG